MLASRLSSSWLAGFTLGKYTGHFPISIFHHFIPGIFAMFTLTNRYGKFGTGDRHNRQLDGDDIFGQGLKLQRRPRTTSTCKE